MQPGANNKTIMVIDDIFEGEYLYTILIAKLGYQVAFYDDPLLALAAVGWVRPVLAVSDVCMPYMDGYALLKGIRRVFPAMPFLMVSATPDNLDRVGGIENCRRLEKPFENANFIDMIKDFLMDIGGNEETTNKAPKSKLPVFSLPWNRTPPPQQIVSFRNNNNSDTKKLKKYNVLNRRTLMNIHVGNLALDVSDSDLQGVFEKFGGVISANVIRNKRGGESRGFGFVEMHDRTEAASAIGELNGTDLKGKALAVNEVRPRRDS